MFREFFREALECKGALVALDRKTGGIIESSRYCWHGAAGELEIGWTFVERAYWVSVYTELDALFPAILDRAPKGEL